LDFAQLTDGLAAEREQGITIDVAYRYFATPKRKFILADTPGHEQYTRNMVTGASTADVAILLIDASRLNLNQANIELQRQSKRHSALLKLLATPTIIV
ncbi:GTP-binding protein, partial [Micrococcus luteus]|nr:GTP-binding protein [Micrococcus luteus]